ncbi:MAG: hypothetical protein ACRD16_01970 [Thermoanaerobaculia bacterium]
MTLSWEHVALFILMALLLVRVLVDAVRAARGDLPATRLILPAVILCELVVLLSGRATRRTLAPMAAAIEIPLVVWGGLAIYRRRTVKGDLPERRIERALSAFVPQPVARALALEFVMIGLGFRILFPPYRRHSEGFGYVRDAYIRFLPVLFVFTVPADVLLLAAVIPRRLWFLHRAITALDVYGLFWILGLVETAQRRPHRISPTSVDLQRGALNRVVFSPALLKTARVVRPFDTRRELKLYARGALLMTLTGSGIVEIDTREPVRGDGLFPAWQRPFSRLLVAADEPEALTKALLAASRGQPPQSEEP